MSELPLELVELVIDGLRDDKKTLQAASLVCVVWRTAAFPYLLHDLLIAEEADYERIKKLCERFPRLSTFHVRTITVRPSTRTSSQLSVVEAIRSLTKLFEDKRWELNKTASELPRMPKVTCLRWVVGGDLHHSIIVGPIIHRYLSLLPSLQRLTLKARFEDLHELELFLGICCSQLKSLTFQGIWFRKSRSRPLRLGDSGHVCNLSSLEKLAFERAPLDPSYDEVVDLLLLFLNDQVSLRSLRVRYDCTMSPTSLERLLHRSAKSLETLMIDPIGVAPKPLWDHPCEPFARIGTHVTSLTVGIPQTIPAGPALTNSAPFEVVDFFHFVQALPPLPHITVVSIIVRLYHQWDASEIWGASDLPGRNMRSYWHRFLPWLVSQMPSLTGLIFFIKFKTKFDDCDHERFIDIIKGAVPPLRPGVDVQLQWMLDPGIVAAT
ncbi:hypothetical protein BDP27DRAFT_1313707 [Rhodocollybia butyracea]|uniref:F-box domain-containing protein n=1 Tax=Rhodocollybia butyracea TaxID=206335 RepID=A0A9P5UEX5_9AGAR|nr:hypothetical protein BDP27DRAFT_1313707 [Rhodocollybia butyracea]